MSSKFPWGKVADYFTYDFDGEEITVIKYNANKFVDSCRVRGEYEEDFSYHIEEINESSNSLQYIIIAYFAYKNLGLNQRSLVSGICKALECK